MSDNKAKTTDPIWDSRNTDEPKVQPTLESLLHEMWGDAKGGTTYNKQKWMQLQAAIADERALVRKYREALEANQRNCCSIGSCEDCQWMIDALAFDPRQKRQP